MNLQLTTPRAGTVSPPARGAARRAALLGLLAASGSVVFIEPAPYDLLAIAMFLGLGASGLRFPRELQWPVILLGLFVFANALAAALAPEPLQTLRSLSIRVYMPMTFLLIASLIASDPRRMLRALWAGYLLAAVLAVCWGTAEYLGLLPGELWQGGLRAKAGFKDPNVFGPFLVPAAIHTVRRLAGGRPRDLGLYLPLFLVLAFGVLLSFSRGAWINFSLSLGLFGALSVLFARSQRQRLGWLAAAILLALLAAGTLAAAVSVDVIGARFYQRAVLAQRYDVAAGGRFDAQRKALEHIGSDPIGVGPGRSDEEFGLEPHNLYLHVPVESGWLGALGFFALLLLTGGRLLALLRRPPPELQAELGIVVACLSGVLVQSLFIDSTHWRHLWLLLAVAWGLIAACRRRPADRPILSEVTAAEPSGRYPDRAARPTAGHAGRGTGHSEKTR